jgi:hypothetical protein
MILAAVHDMTVMRNAIFVGSDVAFIYKVQTRN